MSPRIPRNFRARRTAIALAALTVVALAACEGDDDSMSSEACDAYADFQASMFGDPAAMATAAQAFADPQPKRRATTPPRSSQSSTSCASNRRGRADMSGSPEDFSVSICVRVRYPRSWHFDGTV